MPHAVTHDEVCRRTCAPGMGVCLGVHIPVARNRVTEANLEIKILITFHNRQSCMKKARTESPTAQHEIYFFGCLLREC